VMSWMFFPAYAPKDDPVSEERLKNEHRR